MITSANITGSLTPPIFNVEYDHSRFANYSASDVTKLPPSALQRITTLKRKQGTEVSLAERGTIQCFCQQRQNDSIIEGFFVGESEFYLNESIIQVFDLFGTVIGRKVQDEITLKIEGSIKNLLFEGKLTGDVRLESTSDSKISAGSAQLNFILPNIEKVIISPTTKAIPDTVIYPRESVRTDSYQWREVIDREILFLKDELLKLKADLYIDTVRSSRLQELYGRFLKLNSVNYTPSTIRTIWKATMKLAALGPSQQGFEQSLKEFTGVLPSITTFQDKNLFFVGKAQVGKVRLSTGLVYNTMTIKINNPNAVIYDQAALVQYLKNVKPMHLRMFLITETQSFEIL